MRFRSLSAFWRTSAMGAAGVIAKPFDPETLAAQVAALHAAAG